MKKNLLRSLLVAALAVFMAASFAACSFGGKDVRGSTKDSTYFPNGLLAVQEFKAADAAEPGKWGYIDSKGNLKIGYTYDDAEPFVNGIALVSKTEGTGADMKLRKSLINTKGVEIATYDNIIPLDISITAKAKNLFIAYNNAEKAGEQPASVDFLDAKGKLSFSKESKFLELFYSTADKVFYVQGHMHAGLLQVTNGEQGDKIKYGVIDIAQKGKEIVAAEYDEVSELYNIASDKNYIAPDFYIKLMKIEGAGNDAVEKYGFADAKGKVIVAPTYLDDIYDFDYGVTKVTKALDKDNKAENNQYAYIDTKGKEVSAWNGAYSLGDYSQYGLASVTEPIKDKVFQFKRTIIDKKGNEVMSVTDTDDTHFDLEHGAYIIKSETNKDGKTTTTVFDRKCKEITSFAPAADKTELIVGQVSNYFFTLTWATEGESANARTLTLYKGKSTAAATITSSRNISLEFIKYGFVGVQEKDGNNHNWKIVDFKGNEIMKGQIYMDMNQLVKDWDALGVIETTVKDGKTVTKMGFIDSNGKTIVALTELMLLSPPVGGAKLIAAGQTDDKGITKYGFIDKDGNFKITAKYLDALPFIKGMAPVCNEDGKWGFINEKGEEVISLQYGAIKTF